MKVKPVKEYTLAELRRMCEVRAGVITSANMPCDIIGPVTWDKMRRELMVDVEYLDGIFKVQRSVAVGHLYVPSYSDY